MPPHCLRPVLLGALASTCKGGDVQHRVCDIDPCVGGVTFLMLLQAPLFGMLSWVNSSEVRRWLQTKIADPQSLRCTSSGQDLLANSLARPNSDPQLTGAQDGMPGLPLTGHHSDHPWVGPCMPTPQDLLPM